ncbi:YceI family protein [Hymenobacter rubidus]|uniref:YceI family protein n=1 Tax=Hymenobacter rubidus TaxID=1441626 RepID=UPI00191ED1B7|nr:YceI family protein [Hymenobacter rubidus]
MNRRLLFLLLVLGAFAQIPARAQGKYTFSKGTVRFFSAAPVENIEASSTELKGVLDADAHTFAFRLPITSFVFPSGLMQSHFNENYLESGKFPTAGFRGTLQGPLDLKKDGDYPVTATGDLTIHGVATPRTIPCTVTVRNGVATVASKFTAKLADHRIEVPTLMFNKIAEVVTITVDGTLAPFAAPASAGR